MKQKGTFGFCCAGLILVLAVAALSGCGGGPATPAGSSLGDTYTSPTFGTSYPGALNAYSQLMLGMVRLEGTEQGVTPEQAALLLPLLESLQGQALKSDAERDAVLAYIEAQLTPAQLQAIVAMQLTQDDLTRARDVGQGAGTGMGRGGAGQRGDSGTLPAPGGGTPPDMSTRRAQFGNQGRAQATPGAAAQAGGAFRGTGGVGARSGQGNVLLDLLIRLLAQKAGRGIPPSGANRALTRTPAPTSLPSPTPTQP